MSLIPFDDLLSKRLDNREFVLGYLEGCYRDDPSCPGVFLSAVERIFRHDRKRFTNIESAMPYLHTLGFNPEPAVPSRPKVVRVRPLKSPTARMRARSKTRTAKRS